jgi:hypothetical protein
MRGSEGEQARLLASTALARMRPSALLLFSLAALPSCANVQAPPGGPPDALAPELVTITPESLAVLPGFDDDVEFRFSEVVSEGSQPSEGLGTSELERLVILSPTNRFPDVRWRRRRITVRPAEGWQPDRVYRVELLPGVADVRGNKGKLRRVVTFTTGADVPTDSLAGAVIDWKAGRPSAGALVEAVLQPDSLVYRAQADSSGNFRIGPLPRGEYVVYGVLDANRNLRREPREAFDSIRVPAESAGVGDLYAFTHDTLPPRIQSASSIDSATATITFAAPLDPAQPLDTGAVSLRKLPDSVAVPVRALRRPEREPVARAGAKVEGDSTGRRDSLATPNDTLPPRPPADTARALARTDSVPGRRPALGDRLILEAASPWKPGDRFLLEIRGVRTVSGTRGDVRAPLVIPEVKRPTGQAGRDSTALPDSLPKGKKPVPPRPPIRAPGDSAR